MPIAPCDAAGSSTAASCAVPTACIPSRSSPAAASKVASASPAASFAAVDVNKATVADLDGVKGVGPAMSKRILDERKKGNFKDWNDFIGRVSGVGEATAAKFSAEGLTVNGSTYAPPAAKKTSDKKPAAETKSAKDEKAVNPKK